MSQPDDEETSISTMQESSDDENESDNDTTYTDVSYKTLIDIVKDQKEEIKSLKQSLNNANDELNLLRKKQN
jgi:predicted phosphoribosyltransferase